MEAALWSQESTDTLGESIIWQNINSGQLVCLISYFAGRFYTQISGERARKLAQNRKDRHNASSVEENRIDDHGITAEEVMEQLNKIIAPFKVEFNSALSWFSLWKGEF